MRHESEASVEEILESIKKVIARDNRAGAIEERRRRSQSGLAADAASAPATAAEAPPEPAYDDEADDVLDLAATSYPEDGVAHSATDQPYAASRADDDAPLTGAAARASIGGNLAALAMLAEPGAAPRIVRSGETSLEDLTRELLRPMLAQWLDDNLPGMVERMVQGEIARIAGKRG